MVDSSEFEESLRLLRLEFLQSDFEADVLEEDGNQGEEPLIDDRILDDLSLEDLFQRYETAEIDTTIFSQSTLDRFDSAIPGNASDADTFARFFDTLGISNFAARELLRMGGSNSSGPCKGKNRLPSKHLWPNIVPTIRALDIVRAELGYAINTTSVYRHKEYNECLRRNKPGVAKNSQHLYFRAIDFQGVSGSPSDWYAAVMELKAKRPDFGIWSKRYGSFVHIDTRFAE
jgi:hypothetical protein